jgi:hypothetical protein
MFQRKTNYFNPMSIKKLNFKIYEEQDDGDYVTLKSDSKWYMVLEITTVDVKEKPKDRELQILISLDKLARKLDSLNVNIQRLPDKEVHEPKSKYPFKYLVFILMLLFGVFIYWVNRNGSPGPPQY